MAATTELQPVARALAVLEALNRAPIVPLAELHAVTTLPKPTLVRLLRALIVAGYVEHVSRDAGYRLTERVLRLSRGFRFRDRVVDAAIPPMRRFTAEHGWALYLATMEQGRMVIRFSTARDSPIGIERANHNTAFPALTSALGRAYLAYCPAEERATILATLAATDAGHDLLAGDSRGLDAMLAEVRRHGYALSARMRGGFIGLAIPILRDDQVLASLTLRVLIKAVGVEEAARRYLPRLRVLAEAVAREVASASAD